MAVDPEITKRILADELAQFAEIARSYRWEISPDIQSLLVTTKMRAHDGDLFIVETRFDNYKEWPPFFEFIDPDTGVKGTRHAYPRSTDSFFHESLPCICAPFNRKAYKLVDSTGPHPDWNFNDWATSMANNYDWSRASKFGDMLNMIQTRIITPQLYKGRMQ